MLALAGVDEVDDPVRPQRAGPEPDGGQVGRPVQEPAARLLDDERRLEPGHPHDGRPLAVDGQPLRPQFPDDVGQEGVVERLAPLQRLGLDGRVGQLDVQPPVDGPARVERHLPRLLPGEPLLLVLRQVRPLDERRRQPGQFLQRPSAVGGVGDERPSGLGAVGDGRGEHVRGLEVLQVQPAVL